MSDTTAASDDVEDRVLEPGDTIGIIGGGQLGRMLAMAAARLGLRTLILDPDADCPAAATAHGVVIARHDDRAALEALSRQAAVITYEFENVPVAPLDAADLSCAVRPGTQALAIAQDRASEKGFFNALGIATAPWAAVDSIADAQTAFAALGPGILKTRRLGYDGKGQARVRGAGDIAAAFSAMDGQPAIYEGFVGFEREVSVIAARFADGSFSAFDVPENRHDAGILRQSIVPADIGPASAAAACSAARTLLDALGYVGVAGVEFFVMADGSVVANEFAPRVHNSGHWTEAACPVSQFEQHIRAVAGWTAGDTARHSDAVMHNLVGDDVNDVPRWLATPGAMLHLYGKAEARPGRKMGHVTVIAPHPR
ncbi:MAG: 5-(carboxyamino)imidazole ribonucleotide synthase [Rhizobiaceae bacterium]|nr:5-(carboxyamino)imidazole ribonucleotide synthase [Rhizobiaceae bacterium]